MYNMPMFLTFFFMMIFHLPVGERTGSIIQNGAMVIQPAAGAADCNGEPLKPNSVSEIWSWIDC